MNDRPLAGSVQARMRQLRCEIDGDVEDMAVSARSAVDWKHYVKAYPWVCLGGAAALGFLMVPKRSRTIHPDTAAVAELARTGHLVAKPAPSVMDGLMDALVTTVVTMAVRKATIYMEEGAGRLFGITGQREASRHDSHCTP